MDIPWTPRTIKRVAAKPKPQTDFTAIRGVIVKALWPFEAARIAVSEALAEFDRQSRVG